MLGGLYIVICPQPNLHLYNTHLLLYDTCHVVENYISYSKAYLFKYIRVDIAVTCLQNINTLMCTVND